MRVSELPVGNVHTNVCIDDDSELSKFDEAVLDILDKSSYTVPTAAQYRPEYIAVFSDLGKNCVEWLPIRESDSVLELGADYGQVTGALANKAKSVYCFDFDLIRTCINYVRNREFQNITYCAYTSFADFETVIGSQRFDYIYMSNAFSEAGRYFSQSSDPCKDILLWARDHLSEHGKVVFAADNKYGLKFFNGSRILGEEFYAAPLTGETSMPQHRYFSRDQLEKYLNTVGFGYSRFFYPLPEYRFAMNLYSDEYLPKRGEKIDHNYTWEYGKMYLFEEEDVFYAMAEDGKFRDFANSYLVVAAIGKDAHDDLDAIHYVRFSPGRRDVFDVRTSIVCRNGVRTVQKSPYTWYARRHVANLYENYKTLTAAYPDHPVHFNRCSMNGDTAEFEYLEGKTLSFMISDYLSSGEYDRITAEYDKIFNLLSENADNFVPSREFHEAFGVGHVKLLTLQSPTVSNIDMIPQNIIVTNDGNYHVIDYEWTLPFRIPLLYIIWRGIMYQFQAVKDDKVLFADFLYERYGIDQGLRKVFFRMETQFEKYVYSKKRLDQFPAIGHIKLLQRPVQIFRDYGSGFKSEESYYLSKTISPNGELVFAIELSENLKRLRIDPCSRQCCLKIKSITDDVGKNIPYSTNGTRIGNSCFIFRTTDPQIIIKGCDRLGTKMVHFNMVLEMFLPEIAKTMNYK